MILDGGMGRQLERSGAPFRQPEWSALALMQAPETVLAAHRAFIAAGAELITTNSYALVPFHIGQARFAADGARLAALAGTVARQAADGAGRPIQVAGSLPPLFGSYQPARFDPVRAPGLLRVLVEALSPSVDLFLAETMSSIAEAEAAAVAVRATGKPLWISFTLAEAAGPPRLRSGEPVTAAATAAVRSARRRSCSTAARRKGWARPSTPPAPSPADSRSGSTPTPSPPVTATKKPTPTSAPCAPTSRRPAMPAGRPTGASAAPASSAAAAASGRSTLRRFALARRGR